MRVFAAVVEAGSFTTASTRLDMSRASTSEHIEHLEKHLDEKRMLVILRPNIQPSSWWRTQHVGVITLRRAPPTCDLP
jgi:DNA-binding transcriptional LysR family regulator